MDVTDQHLITVNATNHHGYLINRLWEFIQNKHKTDMCILSNGHMFQAHQLILEVFTSQEQLGYAALHDNSSNLNKILEFMYTGEIRVQSEDLDSLLHLASDLGFGMLVDAVQSARNNSYEISPENSEHENSDMIPSGLVDSDNHAVCDFMPPVCNVSTFEPCSINCHVKQELLDQSIVDDFNLSDTQNVVALENGEGQFVDSLEIHEEVPEIHKYGINADINACSLKVVAGKNESQAGVSDGYSTVLTINESDSSCANSTSHSLYTQRKRTRRNNSECDSLLYPDGKGFTATSNNSSKKLATRAKVKMQLPTHDQILPADASGIGLAKMCNQIKLKNPNTFRDGNVAKCFELNVLKKKKIVETKCARDNQSKIKCSVCSKVLAKCHLKRHMRIHTGERPHACPQCPKTFTQSIHLSLHMRVHTGERPHACPQCPKTFSRSTHLSLHMQIHTGERPFACPQCPKTFSQSSTLSRHMRVHTGERPYACLQCPKTYTQYSHLSLHMQVHTGERPYACPQCPKTFPNDSVLSRHIRTHTGERPFACPHCPKTFSLSNNLSRHMRLHTGERPYVCPHCPKTFSDHSNLSRHMQIHTGEQLLGVNKKSKSLSSTICEI